MLYQMMGHNAPVVKQRSPCKELFERALYHSAEQTEEQERRYLLFSAVIGYRLLSALPQKCHACSLGWPLPKTARRNKYIRSFLSTKGKAYLYYSCKTRLNRTVSAQWPRLPTYLKLPSFNHFTAKKTPQLSTRDSRTKHCRRRQLLYCISSIQDYKRFSLAFPVAQLQKQHATTLCTVKSLRFHGNTRCPYPEKWSFAFQDSARIFSISEFEPAWRITGK